MSTRIGADKDGKVPAGQTQPRICRALLHGRVTAGLLCQPGAQLVSQEPGGGAPLHLYLPLWPRKLKIHLWAFVETAFVFTEVSEIFLPWT